MPNSKILPKIALILLPVYILTISGSAYFYMQNLNGSTSRYSTTTSSVFLQNSTSQTSSEVVQTVSSEKTNILSSVSSWGSSVASISSSVSSKIIEEVQLNFKQLSGQDFNNIFESMNYPKVQILPNHTNITDNSTVDNRIRSLAESRGYRKRASAVEGSMVWIDGQRLQVEASQAWQELRNQAKKEGYNLVMTSGYRSPNEQRNMFVSSMAPEYPTEDFLNGKIDPDLQRIMNIVSPPGYSRHHTGYTIDVACLGESTIFKNTSCYRWASANNFAKVRQFGWIPSYPVGVNNQGPLPEEWEFVWVGELAK
jgi:LAS superfamily LD-carboxypeptidase LdcB